MKNTIRIGGKILDLQKPVIMGIMNITPDSFHKDSRFNPLDEDFLEKANEMLQNGADIIDIGGYSSRPGAADISPQEEIDRIGPAIELISKNFKDCIISVDTFRQKVAAAAINSGARIINDISAGDLDSKMFPYIIKTKTPYILMHMRGNPQTMQELTNYEDFYKNILYEIINKANYLRKNGVHDIILDPGFGFAKTLKQNYDLFKNLELLNAYPYPFLVGISRKSMIYKYLNLDPAESLEASSQMHLQALLSGAKILRVHDVKSAKNSIYLYEILKKQQ
jgi:dihydropteroate synthase